MENYFHKKSYEFYLLAIVVVPVDFFSTQVFPSSKIIKLFDVKSHGTTSLFVRRILNFNTNSNMLY